MVRLPQEAKLLEAFAPAFTAPTYQRFLVLCVGAIVGMGRRTVSRILWAVRRLARGHPSSYHRFFCAARFSLWPLARVLAAAILEQVPQDHPVVVDVDDTVNRHRGKKVWGKGCHRDAVRSSWGHTTFKWGHRWVILAVNVTLPWCRRPWALPVLVALYRGEEKSPTQKAKKPKARKQQTKPWQKLKARRRLAQRRRRSGTPPPPRHKTPALLARQMLATLLHWFPQRRFIVLGDWGFASHELALFCHRHRRRVTLVARTRADMNLYALPPTDRRPGRGRRCRKGAKLPTPQETVAAAQRRSHARLRWYGNSERVVQLLSGCGGWYRARGSGRAALVPIRWVFVHDPQSRRNDYFYSTDAALTPRQIVERFAARWNIEVTFEEARAHLGLETTRERCRCSVLRVVPCLLGLFSLVALLYARLSQHQPAKVYTTPCYEKNDPTFADALAAVRRMLWEQVILKQLPGGRLVTNLPRGLRETLLEHLIAAA
jgi:hypothetical protein